MKKLKLNANVLRNKALSRDELKNILGGFEEHISGSSSCSCSITASNNESFPAELIPAPKSESECLSRCEGLHDRIVESGGRVKRWDAVYVSVS